MGSIEILIFFSLILPLFFRFIFNLYVHNVHLDQQKSHQYIFPSFISILIFIIQILGIIMNDFLSFKIIPKSNVNIKILFMIILAINFIMILFTFSDINLYHTIV